MPETQHSEGGRSRRVRNSRLSYIGSFFFNLFLFMYIHALPECVAVSDPLELEL